jgi:hypothetical protein
MLGVGKVVAKVQSVVEMKNAGKKNKLSLSSTQRMRCVGTWEPPIE